MRLLEGMLLDYVKPLARLEAEVKDAERQKVKEEFEA